VERRPDCLSRPGLDEIEDALAGVRTLDLEGVPGGAVGPALAHPIQAPSIKPRS
jgi:hypothetical protein